MARITQQQLESHLWGSANILRGRTAGQDYKSYILSLMFFKRLCDQYEYEADEKIADLAKTTGQTFTAAQKEALRKKSDIHRFKIPESCHWQDVQKASTDTGKVLTDAMRGIANANKDLAGVFTVDWNQPAPDGSGNKLIATGVVNALIEHFRSLPNGQPLDLSNRNVSADILGRAYEYLIKMFADDAGAKAGEFFTPPEVVDTLIRILEPVPGDTVYDPTCGSGGMLVHSADFLQEQGHSPDQIRYFGQEMNWQTYAIARINTILHGLEADIRGGKSTITDPQFLDSKGQIEKFSLAIANFPFSDAFWWLPSEMQSEEQAKKAKKQFAKDGYKDKFGRFAFGSPPASTGDWAFIQHIIASLDEDGRAGVVCPQGVLFRGQPEVEDETGEFDADGNPKIRRRKADDEYLIRKGLLDARLIDAVIALPLNIFYGAGVPACLLILNKKRPKARRDKVLLVYAARHFRELSNKNQLRPQDVMRILVHYHAYGDPAKAAKLAKASTKRLKDQIAYEEADEIGRITADYQKHAERLAELEKQIADLGAAIARAPTKTEKAKLGGAAGKLEAQSARPKAELAKRDEQIAEVKKRAAEDRKAVEDTAAELVALYADESELAKHARVVDFAEVEENEFNLNIPRYVDTFEPEEPIDVNTALTELDEAEDQRQKAEKALLKLLKEAGYAV